MRREEEEGVLRRGGRGSFEGGRGTFERRWRKREFPHHEEEEE